MIWLIHIFIDAAVLLLVARLWSKVSLQGMKSALVVALLIGVLSFFLSWFFTGLLNIATLGIFYFLGLGFVTRTLAYAIIIWLADKMSTRFKIKGFGATLGLALLLAVVGAVVDGFIL